jgi:replicative DNA helicase
MTLIEPHTRPTHNGFDLLEQVVRPHGTMLSEAMGSVFDDIEQDVPPIEWKVACEPWGSFAFRPHSIVVVGGPTSGGKTAFAQYCLTQAMLLDPSLRVLIANNESQTTDLIRRMVALLAGIDLRHVRKHDRDYCTPEKMSAARALMDRISSRLRFVERPFTVDELTIEAKEFGANIVCLDTLQKATLTGYDGDAQDTVRRIMGMLRALADTGPCVVTAASLSRSGVGHMKGRVGSTLTDEMDTGIFLHSSEIETNANDAYVLLPVKGAKTAQRPDEEYEPIRMWLQHVKSRDDMKAHVPLLFDGRYQKFTLRAVEGDSAEQPAATKRKPVHAASKSPPPKIPALKKKGVDPNGHEWLS